MVQRKLVECGRADVVEQVLHTHTMPCLLTRYLSRNVCMAFWDFISSIQSFLTAPAFCTQMIYNMFYQRQSSFGKIIFGKYRLLPLMKKIKNKGQLTEYMITNRLHMLYSSLII